MEKRRYEFILQAIQPIAHHAESFGNSAIHMRLKIRQPDGSFVNVPRITGDTMRHGLREAAAYAFLDAAGMLDTPALTESALRLLFAGGMITGADAGSVKIDGYREMVELCPPLALLGGCAQNRSIPGRLQVDDAILICEETSHLWSDWTRAFVAEMSIDTHRAHVEEVQRVRMDPSLVPHHRALLTDGGDAIVKRLGKSEKASAKKDAVEKDEAKSTMLPRRYETIVAGSLFMWGLECTCMSELDVDTLDAMCAAFTSNMVVGGKRATGNGRMRAIAAQNIAVLRPRDAAQTLDLVGPGNRHGERFAAHVRVRADRVRAWLSQVEA